MEALRIQPTFAIAWSNLAGLFMESGDLNRALLYYKVDNLSSFQCHLIFFKFILVWIYNNKKQQLKELVTALDQMVGPVHEAYSMVSPVLHLDKGRSLSGSHLHR